MADSWCGRREVATTPALPDHLAYVKDVTLARCRRSSAGWKALCKRTARNMRPPGAKGMALCGRSCWHLRKICPLARFGWLACTTGRPASAGLLLVDRWLTVDMRRERRRRRTEEAAPLAQALEVVAAPLLALFKPSL